MLPYLKITSEKISALMGLPYLQQVTYLLGIRPYMDAPLYKDNYYIFLLGQFEKFWNLYPFKKSQQKAWEQFQALKPDELLCAEILHALNEQIKFNAALVVQGQWVANWKYLENWRARRDSNPRHLGSKRSTSLLKSFKINTL